MFIRCTVLHSINHEEDLFTNAKRYYQFYLKLGFESPGLFVSSIFQQMLHSKMLSKDIIHVMYVTELIFLSFFFL